MSDHLNRPQYTAADDEIDLRELFSVIWRGKWVVIITTVIFAVTAVIYALSLPNIYKSEALLAPASEQAGAGLSGQLGGLAALAGVNLASAGGVDDTVLAIEILSSREFLAKFVDKYQLLPDLIAAKNWNQQDNSLTYDTDIYLADNKKWVREPKDGRGAKPSLQEAYEVFSEILLIEQDPSTSMIRLSVEHLSPHIAAQWVRWLIADINTEMKSRDISEAQSSIAYLEQQIANTQLAEVKTALFGLIEEQTKKLMLANVREEYIFKTIDSAVAPEQKARPARAVLVIVVTFLGGFIAVFAVILRHYFRHSQKSNKVI